jgi:nucleotide-binding universal stress UspA family protein
MEDKAVWETAVGDTAQLLERKGRYADLIVVGQTQQEDTSNNYNRLLDNLVMMTGRPVLVIPDIGIGDSIGKKVLVACDGSREAGRAVSDALDILARADEVHLFSSGDTKKEADKRLESLKTYLSNHGIKATEVLGVTGVKDVGEAMLDTVRHAGLDMIVMGAYGHSRFREMVLGGATRHVLEHTTVPIFMSH